MTEELQETYENVEELSSLMSKNYCVSGKCDEIFGFLKENTLDSVYVENVR